MPGSIILLKGFIYQLFASFAGWRVASLCRFSDATAGNLMPLRKGGRRKTGGRLPQGLLPLQSWFTVKRQQPQSYCASKA
jgi:hypothetical protein